MKKPSMISFDKANDLDWYVTIDFPFRIRALTVLNPEPNTLVYGLVVGNNETLGIGHGYPARLFSHPSKELNSFSELPLSSFLFNQVALPGQIIRTKLSGKCEGIYVCGNWVTKVNNYKVDISRANADGKVIGSLKYKEWDDEENYISLMEVSCINEGAAVALLNQAIAQVRR